jgi:hypothetical protein
MLASAMRFLSSGLAGRGVGGQFLAKKADVVIDLDDAALGGQSLDHVVGHVARGTLHRARQEECDAMMGARLAASAS